MLSVFLHDTFGVSPSKIFQPINYVLNVTQYTMNGVQLRYLHIYHQTSRKEIHVNYIINHKSFESVDNGKQVDEGKNVNVETKEEEKLAPASAKLCQGNKER